jgi:recombination protein RecR
MNYYPNSISRLIRQLCKLPSIGEKSAERLALHLMNAPEEEILELSRTIAGLKQKIKVCSRCFALSDTEICGICSDPSRDSGFLCVVETPADMVAIEKSGAFSGRYHILQGLLSPMDGMGPEDIRLKELIQRIGNENIKEVVIATGTSIEGEATASYISECLAKISVKITRIASGVPMGGEVKYVDQVTLRKAMETRREI